MKRHFIIAYSSLNDMLFKIGDVISQINAALLLSHGIRRNVEITIILVKEWAEIRIVGRYIKNYRPDFESASGLLRRTLVKGECKGISFRRIHYNKVNVGSDIVIVINRRGLKVNYILNTIKHKVKDKITILLPEAIKFISTSKRSEVYYVNIDENLYTNDQIITVLNILLDNIGLR